jgi:hypothetical protein
MVRDGELKVILPSISAATSMLCVHDHRHAGRNGGQCSVEVWICVVRVDDVGGTIPE